MGIAHPTNELSLNDRLLLMSYFCCLSELIIPQLISKIVAMNIMELTDFSPLSVTLNNRSFPIIYQTPFCLQLKLNHHQSLEIAQYIADKLNQDKRENKFFTRVSGRGWLEFIIDDRQIEIYLNQLAKYTFTDVQNIPRKSVKIKFVNYYLHARCCSLLTSAHQLQIISINNLNFDLNQWQIINPKVIPYSVYLNSQPEEISIVKQIILIQEKIKVPKITASVVLKQLESIFLQLEKKLNLGNINDDEDKQLCQAKLGLIAIILKCYQNIFFEQNQQLLPREI